MRGGREREAPMGVNHMLSEDPIRTRRELVELLIDTQGAPEVRTHELVWNLELIASRESRERPVPVPAPHVSKPRQPHAREARNEDTELKAAARELGIDLSGVRKEDS